MVDKLSKHEGWQLITNVDRVIDEGGVVRSDQLGGYINDIYMYCLFVWWCLMPLSTIFQLNRGGLFY